ncbi:MAG: arginine--tRNA ligase [bacterium]|nr:arginine--tRNA ligase [bacterium]
MQVAHDIKAAIARVVGFSDFSLEHPADLKNGDYSCNIAMQLFGQAAKASNKEFKDDKNVAPIHTGSFNFNFSNLSVYKKPRDLADNIVKELGEIPGVIKVEAVGAGFINFYLAPSALAEAVETARKEDMWGSNSTQKGKTIMMEYTDPNPFKEFHIGHLVPNALGESVSRLFQFSGATVKRANYQGDVGIHVAKSIFILLEKNVTDPSIADLSAAYPEGSKRYEEDTAAKEAIDALNKKIYDKSDAKVNDLYAKGRKLSLEHFEEIYKVLGTKFDYYFFESEAGPVGVKIVRAHPEIFPESEGAIIFRGEEHGLHTRVFLNKQGLPTYEAKELGLAKLKEEACAFDLTITITGNEQGEYFKVVMKAMELALPELRGKLAYKTNGMLRFAEGKMSSRTGNIIRGEDLLNDLADAAKVRAAESRADDTEKLSQEIAVAAIKYQILKQAFSKDIIFDRERALSLEGDSGPYLQYAHARAQQIVEKAKEQNVAAKVDPNIALDNLTRLVHRFPEAVEYAAAHTEPHLLTNYLLEFASAFNTWYAQVHILDGTPEAAHKVAVVDAVRRTLKNGLWILGIPAPERM